MTNINWDTSEEIVVHLNNVWATDEYIADSLFYISNKATKSISTKEDWIVDVPDYNTRLNALNSIAKMKWLFEKWKKKLQTMPENVIYVLKK